MSTVTPNTEQLHRRVASPPPSTVQYVASSPPLHKRQPSFQTQYDTAKDIVLFLLGWVVPPQYLLDCGLSREIVFYISNELNLRSPQNLIVDEILPYIPATLGSLLRPRDQMLSPPQRRLIIHPSSTSRLLSSTEQVSPRDTPNMLFEHRGRDETLTLTQTTTKSVDTEMKNVEILLLAPSESVDDVLRTIEPATPDKMDVRMGFTPVAEIVPE
ncbi:hypothetical protein FB446DRAFT_810166 [Lentinula raphanica]|nr:hypothetical protein FB446DRAFT_810166 [Lentinula raphanica]